MISSYVGNDIISRDPFIIKHYAFGLITRHIPQDILVSGFKVVQHACMLSSDCLEDRITIDGV